MPSRNSFICVSTKKPPNGGAGSCTVIDFQSGAILSSLRVSDDLAGNTSLGISSLSPFPSSSAASFDNKQCIMACGDTSGFLICLRKSPLPPILNWKCRLPESKLTAGLKVSPCGRYIIGGGQSGSCHVWSTDDGALLKTFRAHYRACTCITWTRCGRYVTTGGADGIVHCFSLMDLVDKASRNSKQTIPPILTWSNHHFPISCVINLDGDRLATASEDGQVVIMESFCKQTIVATIKFPHGICSTAYLNSRLYAGSTAGTIFSVDLDSYALHQTEKQGGITTKRRRQECQNNILDGVLAKNVDSDDSDMTRKYHTDWVGHDHAVTAIAAVTGYDSNERLVSGDEAGTVRIWDVASRVCVNVLRPWATTTKTPINVQGKGKNTSQTSQSYPISSISIVPQLHATDSSGMFASSNNNTKSVSGHSNLIPPLQKYTKDESENDSTSIPVPLLGADRSTGNLGYWLPKPIYRKRKQTNSVELDQLDARATIMRLEMELEKKQEEIKRWEKVNNKLMAKLKHQK